MKHVRKQSFNVLAVAHQKTPKLGSVQLAAVSTGSPFDFASGLGNQTNSSAANWKDCVAELQVDVSTETPKNCAATAACNVCSAFHRSRARPAAVD